MPKFNVGDFVAVKGSKTPLRQVEEIRIDPPNPNQRPEFWPADEPYYRLNQGWFWPEHDLERAYA